MWFLCISILIYVAGIAWCSYDIKREYDAKREKTARNAEKARPENDMARNCKKCKSPDCMWVGADDYVICDEYLPQTNWDRIRLATADEFSAMYIVLASRFGIGDREELLEWLNEECKE